MFKVIVTKEADGTYSALGGDETLGNDGKFEGKIVIEKTDQNLDAACRKAKRQAEQLNITEISGLP